MKKGNLTREQAIEKVGIKTVEAVEAENCEPTNRIGYNGACQGDALIEWSASVEFKDAEGIPRTITAYYYTDEDDEKIVEEAGGDWSYLSWNVAGYEID